MNKGGWALVVLLCLMAAPWHGHQVWAADKPPLRVVASFSILGDMVKQVGGDAVAVTVLVGPDSDAHGYQPTPEDAKAVAAADIIAINGLGLEGWIGRIIEASGSKARLLVASAGVKLRVMEHDGKVAYDPHAWQDLRNGRLYVRNIAGALMAAVPEQAEAIRKRATAYDAELKAMDKSIREQFESISEERRKIVTSHDAFGYFGEAYGVTFLAPLGMNDEAAAASDVAALIRQIKDEGIKTVFLENMTNPRLIRQIAEDSGATVGGTLYSDSLSDADGSAPSYLDMFKNNVPKFKAAMDR